MTLAADLIDLHRRARGLLDRAQAIHSGFPVGAALRSVDGDVVCGVNVENDAYPLTTCAERGALSAAVAAGHTEFDAVAIAGNAATLPPCGACRQTLAQFAAPGFIVVFPKDGDLVAMTLDDLLPVTFKL